MKNLIHEIHRRSLWQVLGIYLAGSWVALQVVEQLAEAASLPAWVRPAALALLVIGFPIVMATAFVQEGLATREHGASGSENAGLDSPAAVAPRAPSGAAGLLTWRNAILGGVGAFALWGIAVTVMMALGVGPAGSGGASRSADAGRIAIAVLPFSNLGDDDQSRVFSLGIHDDLLTRLSKIGSLRVTSRTSVMQYADQAKPIPQIADELGVDYVLEGSVLGAGGQVNINAQLIDGASDEHLWAETYNRALSVSGVFTIQKELAQRITESLSAALLPDEVAAIEAPPTENLDAYNAYLRGHTYFEGGPRSRDFDLAIEMYGRAVEIDPEFAEAHARLSYALGLRYEVQRVGDPDLLARELRHAERAYELDPDLPEAALALGQYYYSGERNLPLAMEHLTRAGEENLHSADVFHLLGAVQRRMGDLDGSAASWEELVRIDPLSTHYLDDLSSTYGLSARWDDQAEVLERWLALDPETTVPHNRRATALIAQGRLDRAEAVLDSVYGAGEGQRFLRWRIAVYRRDWDGAREAIPGGLLHATTLDWAGDPGASAAVDSTIARLEARIAENPDAAVPHADVAQLYAMRGRREDAVRAVDRAIELLPVASDFMDGPDGLWAKTVVRARLGDVDEAIATLEELLSNKPAGYYTTPELELEPALDPVRDHARFAELLAANALVPSR